MHENAAPRVIMKGISKRFGAISALESVHLSLAPGEVLGLVGDNGAGKSTLMKILSGAIQPDEGDITIDGRQAMFRSPRDSRAVSIEMIYQDLALCDDLDVASNVYLGREPSRFGLLNLREMHRSTTEALERLGIRITSSSVTVRMMSGGQRQAVAIGRAVLFNPRVLIMDEPTAALGVHEVTIVLDLIRNIKKEGVSVIIVSHRLQDIMDVCDRIIVLYEGRNHANLEVSQTTLVEVVAQIMGG